MILPIYITIVFAAFLLTIFSFFQEKEKVKPGNYFLAPLLAAVLFFMLSLSSANMEIKTCSNEINTSLTSYTQISNLTNSTYTINNYSQYCNVNTYYNGVLVSLFLAMGLITILVGLVRILASTGTV